MKCKKSDSNSADARDHLENVETSKEVKKRKKRAAEDNNGGEEHSRASAPSATDASAPISKKRKITSCDVKTITTLTKTTTTNKIKTEKSKKVLPLSQQIISESEIHAEIGTIGKKERKSKKAANLIPLSNEFVSDSDDNATNATPKKFQGTSIKVEELPTTSHGFLSHAGPDAATIAAKKKTRISEKSANMVPRSKEFVSDSDDNAATAAPTKPSSSKQIGELPPTSQGFTCHAGTEVAAIASKKKTRKSKRAANAVPLSKEFVSDSDDNAVTAAPTKPFSSKKIRELPPTSRGFLSSQSGNNSATTAKTTKKKRKSANADESSALSQEISNNAPTAKTTKTTKKRTSSELDGGSGSENDVPTTSLKKRKKSIKAEEAPAQSPPFLANLENNSSSSAKKKSKRQTRVEDAPPSSLGLLENSENNRSTAGTKKRKRKTREAEPNSLIVTGEDEQDHVDAQKVRAPKSSTPAKSTKPLKEETKSSIEPIERRKPPEIVMGHGRFRSEIATIPYSRPKRVHQPPKRARRNERTTDSIFNNGPFTFSEREAIAKALQSYMQIHDIPKSDLELLCLRSTEKEDNPYTDDRYASLRKDVLELAGINRTPEQIGKFLKRYGCAAAFESADGCVQEWTEEDEERLSGLVALLGRRWEEIGRRMGRRGCYEHWRVMEDRAALGAKSATAPVKWTKEEEARFIEAVAVEGGLAKLEVKKWTRVAEKVGKTVMQCRRKARSSFRAKLSGGGNAHEEKWGAKHDAKLVRSLIKAEGNDETEVKWNRLLQASVWGVDFLKKRWGKLRKVVPLAGGMSFKDCLQKCLEVKRVPWQKKGVSIDGSDDDNVGENVATSDDDES